MAGRRREHGRPTQARARHQRRRDLLTDRLAAARTDLQRLAAVYDHVRLVYAALAAKDRRRAAALATELTQTMLAAAEAADPPPRR